MSQFQRPQIRFQAGEWTGLGDQSRVQRWAVHEAFDALSQEMGACERSPASDEDWLLGKPVGCGFAQEGLTWAVR